MKDQLVFDTTDANTIADSDHVGSHTLSGAGDQITSGDGSADNIANTYEGLDTRGFMFGYDSVGDNWDRIQQVSGAMKVFIDDGDFEVDVVINAEKAEDAAHSSGDTGNFVLAVRQDTLAASTDTDGDYAAFKVDSVGSLYTRDTNAAALLTTIDADTGSIDTTLTGLSHAEDAAHVSGDAGIMGLAVRNDTLAALADTDGDYAPLQVDADGALYVNVASSGELTVTDAALANTAIANAVNTLAAANTAEDVVASPLANRKYLWIYNNDNRKVYIGASGVSAADGFPVSPSSYVELRAGAAIDIEWVSAKTGHDIRTLELS